MFSVMVRLHVLGMELFGHLLCPVTLLFYFYN